MHTNHTYIVYAHGVTRWKNQHSIEIASTRKFIELFKRYLDAFGVVMPNFDFPDDFDYISESIFWWCERRWFSFSCFIWLLPRFKWFRCMCIFVCGGWVRTMTIMLIECSFCDELTFIWCHSIEAPFRSVPLSGCQVFSLPTYSLIGIQIMSLGFHSLKPNHIKLMPDNFCTFSITKKKCHFIWASHIIQRFVARQDCCCYSWYSCWCC